MSTRSRGRYCSVTACKNTDYILSRWKNSICPDHLNEDGSPLMRKDCICLIPLSFHVFPPKETERLKWIQYIQRGDWVPNKRALVCSEHFIDGRPTPKNPYPTENIVNIKGAFWQEILNWPKETVSVSPTPTRQQRTVDSLIAATGKGFLHDILKQTSQNSAPQSSSENTEPMVVCQSGSQSQIVTYPGENGQTSVENSREIVSPQTINNLTTTHSLTAKPWQDCNETGGNETKNITTQVDTSFFDYVSRDDCKIYTGLDYAHFCFLLELLTQNITSIPCKMDVSHQVFLVLTKLRQNPSFKDLARKFGISTSLAREIFKFWLPNMAAILSGFLIWLPRETTRSNLPLVLKENHPNVTCVISRVRIVVKPTQRLNKNRPKKILKYFIVFSPTGFIMNVSKVHKIKVRDEFIVQQCGLDCYHREGDKVLTNSRVNLKFDGLSEVKWHYIGNTDLETKLKLNKVLGLNKVKRFKILKNNIPYCFAKNLDEIVYVCCALCNLQTTK